MRTSVWRTFGRSLLVVGAVLLLPGACYVSTGPTDDDASVAFTPIGRLSLSSLKSPNGIRIRHTVPKVTPQWVRIRQALGDLGYIVLACDKRHGKIIPFKALYLELSIVGRSGPIPVQSERAAPYAYSSDTDDVGVRFKPAPGDEVSIDITAHHPELLPAGELVIEPYWGWNAKDFLVGASLDSEYGRYARWAGIAGVVLVLAGGAICARRTH